MESMMQSQHTAGPWKWIDYPDGRKLLAASECAVIHCPDGAMGIAAEDQALIAAAPDLLAALRAILAEPHGCSLCDSGKPRNAAKGHQPDCGYLAGRAAVAKAIGG